MPMPMRDRVASIAIDGTSATSLLVDEASGRVLQPAKLYNEAQGEAAVQAAKVRGTSRVKEQVWPARKGAPFWDASIEVCLLLSGVCDKVTHFLEPSYPAGSPTRWPPVWCGSHAALAVLPSWLLTHSPPQH